MSKTDFQNGYALGLISKGKAQGKSDIDDSNLVVYKRTIEHIESTKKTSVVVTTEIS